MTGLIGFASGYQAMEACDALLMLGTDFPYRQFFPKDARIAQVDIRAEAIGRRAPVELGLVGQVVATLRALLPRLVSKRDRSYLDAALKNYAEARKGLDDLASGRSGGPLHPQLIARVANELASDDAIFTCDVGLPTVWAARYLAMNGRRRLVGSFWHGSMANAMAQAIGAQAACPQRQVISLSGDGGFTMLMGDLLSLSQLKLPVKVIVFNNGALGFIELEQKSTGFLDTGTELINPNFAAMAEAIGIKGVRIEDPAEVQEKLAEALAHPGPVLIDAVVNRMELAMPPKVTAEMAKGYFRRHCQLHAVDDRIDEHRTGMSQGLGELLLHLRRILDAHALDADGLSHGREVRIDKLGSGVEKAGRLLFELDEAERTIVEHDHFHRELELRQAQEISHQHGESTVAGQRDHLALRESGLSANGLRHRIRH